MIELGAFTSKSGKQYDCRFLKEEGLVQAVGPLPESIGARGVAFEVKAESEEEARSKILEAIGNGTLP